MSTFGGVDTYYDYDEGRWKYRRLGGGPVHPRPICPVSPRRIEAGRPSAPTPEPDDRSVETSDPGS